MLWSDAVDLALNWISGVNQRRIAREKKPTDIVEIRILGASRRPKSTRRGMTVSERQFGNTDGTVNMGPVRKGLCDQHLCKMTF